MINNEQPEKIASIEYLNKLDIAYEKIVLDSAPHTAQNVVDACKCPIEEVLKTLVFIGDESLVIAVVAGNDKADINKLCNISKQETLRMAKPEEVLDLTSCKVGTVSPFVQPDKGCKIMDLKVLDLAKSISGSGLGTLLLSLNKNSLQQAWDGEIADIAK